LFAAKDLGAGKCIGFDVREHWIEQAHFLLAQREPKLDDVRFETRDLYELPELSLDQFDVTIFAGIFYHLPNPIAGLRIAADLTKELIIVNSSVLSGRDDGFLAAATEGTESPVSGVYGLSWLPTGPAAVGAILKWRGFVHTRVAAWDDEQPPRAGWGRLEMMGARAAGLLDALDPFTVRRFLRGLKLTDPSQIAHAVRSCCSPQVVIRRHHATGPDPVRGREAVRELVLEVLARTGGVRYEIEAAEPGRLLFRLTGPYSGLAPGPDVRHLWRFALDEDGLIEQVDIHPDRQRALA
jgi:hypothetical protein